MNWQGWCQVGIWLVSLFLYISAQNYIPFSSTLSILSHMPTFLFQSTLSQHEAEKVGMLVLFCQGTFLFWLFCSNFFPSVCLLFIFPTFSTFFTSIILHGYHVSCFASGLYCMGCLVKCCMLLEMQCFKMKWLVLKNSIG